MFEKLLLIVIVLTLSFCVYFIFNPSPSGMLTYPQNLGLGLMLGMISYICVLFFIFRGSKKKERKIAEKAGILPYIEKKAITEEKYGLEKYANALEDQIDYAELVFEKVLKRIKEYKSKGITYEKLIQRKNDLDSLLFHLYSALENLKRGSELDSYVQLDSALEIAESLPYENLRKNLNALKEKFSLRIAERKEKYLKKLKEYKEKIRKEFEKMEKEKEKRIDEQIKKDVKKIKKEFYKNKEYS